jgi:4,5-dihydroxyphthalate decarboxylase
VERAAPGKDLMAMLLAGEVDAAVSGERVQSDPRVVPLIPDPDAAARAWCLKHGAIQINHMVTVKASLSKSQPDAVREVGRLLAESKRMGGPPPAGEPDTTPFGVEANRRNLEVAIDYLYRQRMIPRRFTVDELFDDVTRKIA